MADITISDLTTGQIDGTGAFDKLMQTVQIRLQAEFDAGRINSADYAQVYLSGMTAVMQQSIAFVLGEQEADKKAELLAAQILQIEKETLNAEKQNEILEEQRLKLIADTELVAQQKVNLISEELGIDARTDLTTKQVLDVQEETINKNKQGLILDEQLTKIENDNAPLGLHFQQTELAKKQVDKTAKDILLIDQQASNLLAEAGNISKQGLSIDSGTAVNNAQVTKIGKEADLLDGQITKLETEEELLELEKVKSQYENTNMLPLAMNKATAENNLLGSQKDKVDMETGLIEQQDINLVAENANISKMGVKLDKEAALLEQKKFTEQAQVDETIGDENSVIGKQKALYAKQTEGFDRDAEQKLMKIVMDAHITGMNISDDASLPTSLEGEGINDIINKAKEGINITN